MQINILNYKNWHTNIKSLINQLNRILFIIIINKIIYNFMIRLCKIL